MYKKLLFWASIVFNVSEITALPFGNPSDPAILQFKLISMEPADISGYDGFSLVFTYRNQQGVEMQTIYYGAVIESSFVSLRYNAAKRHYFETELPTFRNVFHSLDCMESAP